MPLSESLEKSLQTMNGAQREAATHGKGAMLVLAGPGSGKSYTVCNRISYLIEFYHVPPEQILVITFTKEAADSMRQRFLNAQSKVCPVNFGTFHAAFYQILRRSFQGRLGGILTDSEKKQFMIPILAQWNRRGEEIAEDAAQCLAALSYYKNTRREEAAAKLLPEYYRAHFREILARYERAREESRRLDFDDMLFGCLNLFRSQPDILHFWQKKFRYLLIDEFQDVNPIQYEAIRLMAGPKGNLFAVGDDDQSIYGFRGSEPRLMRQFLKDYPECGRVSLNINYRSRPEIVSASLKVINENKDRFPKKLTAYKTSLSGTEGAAESHCAVTIRSFPEREDQYRYLAEKLRQMENPEQCAVLFRTNAQMQGFASRLAKEEIPFSMKEKCGCIYDHFIAKDLNGYLQFSNGDTRRSLFLTIMNKPSRWISREAVPGEEVDFEGIRNYYRQFAPPEQAKRVSMELRKLETDLLRLRKLSPYLAVQFLRKGVGYENYLMERAGPDRGKLSEWMEILEFLATEASGYRTYPEWLAMQQAVREEMKGNASKKEEKKGVRLMTAHASKGLEFDRVYIPDVNEGTYPHGHMLEEEAVEEERRIFYVAMTRAKEALEILFVTGSKERPRLPSRFLNLFFP